MRKIWGVITVENVTINYPSLGRPALDNVSFTLQSGEFAFLIGSSGSGKTSFFRALLREEKLSHGKIFLGNFPVHKIPQRKIPILRQSLGCIFQDFRLLPDRTVGENIAFSLEVIGKNKSYIYQRVPEVLEEVGLSGKMHRLPHELSGGEQQRTAIARAIANKPLMVLADEPTGNLDPETSTEIVDLLDRINRGGTTVLMATHDRQIVNLLRTRVLELHQGKLVRDEERGTYSISKN